VVTATPHHLRTPVAFAATVSGVVLATAVLAVPTFLVWFGPVLLIKLLLAHLLPDQVATDRLPSTPGPMM
jgi:hypothetical protein